MTDPLSLVDPAWRNIEFDHEQVVPGEAFPNLDGMTLAVDVETRPTVHIKKAGLSAFHADVLGVSVGCPELRRCWYVPLRHRAPGAERFNVDPGATMRWLADIMPRAKLLLNQNLKFDAKFLDREGVRAQSYDHVPLYDTQVGSVLIDERESSALKPTALRVLGMPPDEQKVIEQYIVGSQDFQDWSYVPADLMAPYGCGDVERAIRLAGAQRSALASEGVEDVMRLELDVLRDLIHAELRGARVDVPLLQRDLPGLLQREIAVSRRIEELVGASVNPGSPKDLAEMFISKLGLPIINHKPGRDRAGEETLTPVFDDATLQTYARLYPKHGELMFRLRQARRMEHVRGFVQSYLELQVDGYIHTTIKQVEARTGRESSEMPNLQQITGEEYWDYPSTLFEFHPIPNVDVGYDGSNAARWVAPGCERYFLAPEGHAILSFDYSQIEYRFFAHYLNDPRLLDAYRDDATLDMHQWAAHEILEDAIERDDAKSANFGIVFGMGQDKLVKFMATNGVGITDARAAAALSTYHARVPGLRKVQRDVGNALLERGYVRTILGRKRRAEKNRRRYGEKRDKKKERGLAPYQALNALCQGGGVDLIKDRSVAANRVARQFGGELFLKVHDDAKFVTPLDVADRMARELMPVLTKFERPDGTPYLRVPIYAKCTKTTTSWYDAEKLDLIEEVV